MSPVVYLDNTAGATIYKITGSSGSHTYLKVDSSGTALRPYISLKSSAELSKGIGTSEEPYVIISWLKKQQRHFYKYATL